MLFFLNHKKLIHRDDQYTFVKIIFANRASDNKRLLKMKLLKHFPFTSIFTTFLTSYTFILNNYFYNELKLDFFHFNVF